MGQNVDLLLGGGLPVSTIQGRNDKEGVSRRRKQIQRGRVTVVLLEVVIATHRTLVSAVAVTLIPLYCVCLILCVSIDVILNSKFQVGYIPP